MKYLEDAYHSAREALRDMDSHESSFAKAFGDLIDTAKDDSSLDATEYDREERSDNISYYEKEQGVVRRMANQARHALRVLPPSLSHVLTIDLVAEATSNFVRKPIAKNIVLACLHAPETNVPFRLLEPMVQMEIEGETQQIDPIIVRFVRSFMSLLPKPKETKLTRVMVRGPDGTEVDTHFSDLTVGAVFAWGNNPTKYYRVEAAPIIYYGGEEPIWSVKCDPIEVSDAAV